MASSKRSPAGCGTIRKKVVQRGGKEYVYWEARYSNGFDPGTGKQIQKSISGKTQKEVVQKLKAVTAAIDEGTYIAPCKMTVGQWLDIWANEYLGAVKPRTANHYQGVVNSRIKPGLGAVKLDALNPHTFPYIDRSPPGSGDNQSFQQFSSHQDHGFTQGEFMGNKAH